MIFKSIEYTLQVIDIKEIITESLAPPTIINIENTYFNIK